MSSLLLLLHHPTCSVAVRLSSFRLTPLRRATTAVLHHHSAFSSVRAQRTRFPVTGRPSVPIFPSSCAYQSSSCVSSESSAVLHVNDEHVSSASRPFKVTAPFAPAGDQPDAITELVDRVLCGDKYSILQGATGTGKTFVMSHVIARLQRPTLVLCHNKTLAAQLARELRGFLKHNAVELFVSYYDHYTPESFVETTGKYIAKKSSVNEEIDSLRHRATRALLERKDVVVVASVSCIYGLGLPAEYIDASVTVVAGDDDITMEDLVDRLGSMLYTFPENGEDMLRGNYVLSETTTANGEDVEVVTLWPPHEKFPVRIAFEKLQGGRERGPVRSIHQATERGLVELETVRIFPAKHHITDPDRLEEACLAIEEELHHRLKELQHVGKVVEAQRLQQRVLNDLLMLRETGFCSGGENYSRHFSGREVGEPPDTLIDYMHLAGGKESDWLLVVDESHVTLPQLKAMYGGDQARKRRLVKHGFRLPSALDNRPLKDTEFWDQVSQAVFVSATPSRQELGLAIRDPIRMIIRPTYVCDPTIHVRPTKGQLDDLLLEVQARASRNERTLALALTKRDAEDLASFLLDMNVKATYIHSGLTTLERSDALKALQRGDIDCLVGVNLLREGLDLPQVSLVAILNADSEGFLRSETALLQTVGRAARNVNGEAIFYGNRITGSMQRCIDDTRIRRERQTAYNEEFGCKSQSTKVSNTLSIFDLLREEKEEDAEYRSSSQMNRRGPERTSMAQQAPIATKTATDSSTFVVTDHIPSKPGVYFWKDGSGDVLYIGKGKNLRSRVKSYLSPNAKHSQRISVMVSKAQSVEFLLTPSDRDAMVLESNLIKLHQPPYNVLLKDDESYPYICASVGDEFPRFFAVPRKFGAEMGERAERYRYFGPYPHFNEINSVLDAIEEKYDLRAKSFAARHGTGDKSEYNKMFDRAMLEVFDGGSDDEDQLPSMRAKFEEAGMLFGSVYNQCRDIVALERDENDKKLALVHVLQLRSGLAAGQFTYGFQLPSGLTSNDDCAAALQIVLERQHYSSAEECPRGRFSFFPDEILTQYPISDAKSFKQSMRNLRRLAEPKRVGSIAIRTPATRGPRKDPDVRAMDFAIANAREAFKERARGMVNGATGTSLDGTAVAGIAQLMDLKESPGRIECFDISHTQGGSPVGSRVVFVDGKPARHLYRTFNIKTVEGVDDYACLEEVLHRRFQRVWVNGGAEVVGKDSEWSLPDLVVVDGGRGQLSAAIKGMAKANVHAKQAGTVWSQEGLMPCSPEAFNDTVGVGVTVSPVVPVCALAKNHEEVFVRENKFSLNDSTDCPALLLLRAIRDESHRFALSAHRKRRAMQGGLR